MANASHGGTKKPLTKAQTDEAKKRKEAFLSGKPLDSDEEDNGKAEAAKSMSPLSKNLVITLLPANANHRRPLTDKKILAEARAAAGKKGPISLGGQGIKKSGKK
ncbi:hypothetical protein CRV24_006129 [Beauveria bassiana]|nr:hypothetical protein CRV24_006129 [Beauveria bassiana]